MTTAPTNEMLALADELDAKLPVFHGRERDLIVRVVTALRLAATTSARDVREALSNMLYYADEWYRHIGSDATMSDDFKEEIEAARKLVSTLSNLDAAAPASGGDAQWPDPKVTNPDIANPTGNPYIDCLLHRLLDAQQDINFHANSDMNQSLADAAALIDEVETAIRKLAAPPLQAPSHSDAVREAFRAGYWAWCGPANPVEYDLHVKEEQESWDKYKSTLSASEAKAGEPFAWADSTGAERPITAEAKRMLGENPTVSQYTQRFSIALYAAPTTAVDREAVARETWAHIENLLIEECGLMADCGLAQQRPNFISAITNYGQTSSPEIINAAVEFLRAADGLTGLSKVRVNGKMMGATDIAAILSLLAPTAPA